MNEKNAGSKGASKDKMSKHTITAFRLGGTCVEENGLDNRIFITTVKEANKIYDHFNREYDRGLMMDDWISFHPCGDRQICKGITDKQLEKFMLDNCRSVLAKVYEMEGMEQLSPENSAHIGCLHKKEYVDTWNRQGNKYWWNDFKEELEEAKYNPRNPLGQLEFDRRAEADGIVWKDDC